jgi:hypothetical protein
MWGSKKEEQPKPILPWEPVDINMRSNRLIYRTPIPMGWLVIYENGESITFVPDQDHVWKV